MADTIREKIIQAAAIKAAALSTLSVNRCERSIGESASRFVSVWDGDDTAIDSKYGGQRAQFGLAIEAIWKSTSHSVEANAVLGEIISLFIGTDRNFGGLALNTKYSGSSIQYPQDGGNYTTLTVIFNITYETVLGDPTTQLSA